MPPLPVLLGVHLPVLLALAASVAAVAPELGRRARLGQLPALARNVPVLAVLLAGVAAVATRVASPGPVQLASALALFASLAVFPSLALLPPEPAAPPLDRRLWLVLAALVLLATAQAVEATLGVGRVLGYQAVDMVGELRLADLRPDVADPSAPGLLLAQLLLSMPYFLVVLPLLLPGVALLWPLGLVTALQAAWQVPAAAVARLGLDRRGVPAGIGLVLAMGVGLHPLLLDKGSWDLNPPGCLLFLLAWHDEQSGRRRRFALWLALAACCHPVQAGIALVWAADSARRAWPDAAPRDRRDLLLAPAVVGFLAAISAAVLVGARFVLPAPETLTERLAFFDRHWAAAALDAGQWGWLASLGGANVARAALVLLPLGFLPVLRWNRFLAYALVEVAYSSVTPPTGLLNGSLPALVGILGCAAFDNVRHARPGLLRAAATLSAVSLLPLALWTGSLSFATSLLQVRPADRLPALAALSDPADRDRTCVGAASTYAWLAGRCAADAPFRLGDDAQVTIAADADVYLVDLGRLLQRGPRTAPGLSDRIRGVVWNTLPRVDGAPTYFGFDQDVATDDLLRLRDRLRSGWLAVTGWDGSLARLQRAPAAPGAGDDSSAQVADALDRVLQQRASSKR